MTAATAADDDGHEGRREEEDDSEFEGRGDFRLCDDEVTTTVMTTDGRGRRRGSSRGQRRGRFTEADGSSVHPFHAIPCSRVPSRRRRARGRRTPPRHAAAASAALPLPAVAIPIPHSHRIARLVAAASVRECSLGPVRDREKPSLVAPSCLNSKATLAT